MKAGFAARWSPLDKRSWSGTPHYSYEQIRRYYDTEIFTYQWPWWLREWLTAQKSLNKRIFKKHTAVEFCRAYAKYFSRQLEKDLQKRPVDILFVSGSAQLAAYLKTDIPIIYATDATFQQLQGYYPYFSNLAGYNIRQGIALDKKTFMRAEHCMLASDWCRRSAIEDYGISEHRITVTPLGANLDRIPQRDELNLKAGSSCRLLFLAVEWERKGGAIALDSFRLLKERGVDVSLHIIGCVPPVDTSAEKNITVIPFLDKNKQEDMLQLHRVFLETDFLLLPTRAECAGIVFSEAAAYGIPSISTDTGGVTTYVRNGVNGFTLPPDASAMDYARQIENIVKDKPLLEKLKRSSRDLFEQELSWDQWGRDFAGIARNILEQRNARK